MKSPSSPRASSESHAVHGSIPALTLGALGIVFGDIGTSPLYTMSECVNGKEGSGSAQVDVLGVLSLIFWALMLVVTMKYISFVMRADNRGEGGILALLALLPKESRQKKSGITVISLFVVMGAALLYGDGAITPAISVLSAVEGLGVATESLKEYVVPITCLILLGLFAIQHKGTAGIGTFFGPVMLIWFLTIGGLGAWHIAHNPVVLSALSPMYGARYVTGHGLRGFLILGSVVLAVTGGEAVYADMGHFGARPIRISWFTLVLPGLVLSYFGQGALILGSTTPLSNPFFAQVPHGIPTYALVGLATIATVIASQALISGVFSLTHQAIALGFFPRVLVKHTSSHAEGQIYLPAINWALAAACIALAVKFEASERLAAAYGIAVSGTMGITSIVYYAVARETWKWPIIKALPLLVLFLSFDLAFFGANLFKFKAGGYIPISIAAVLTMLMLVWNRGRRLLAERNAELAASDTEFVRDLDSRLLGRLPGTGIFLTGASKDIPRVLNQQATRLRVLNETVIVLTMMTEHVPFVSDNERVTVDPLDKKAGIYRVIAHVGFMESPNVPDILELAKRTNDLPVDLAHATYFIGRETLLATNKGKMGAITETIFGLMHKNARSAADHFSLPSEHVIEIGTQLDL